MKSPSVAQRILFAAVTGLLTGLARGALPAQQRPELTLPEQLRMGAEYVAAYPARVSGIILEEQDDRKH